MTLLCLGPDDDEATARDLASALDPGSVLAVVRVAAPGAPVPPSATAWVLRCEAPARPLPAFARSRRARRLVLGPDAWRNCGEALRREGDRGDALAGSSSVVRWG